MPQRFINGHNRHRHDEDTKARIAEAGRGRKPSPETRRKISLSKIGERNPMWRGGSFERRRIRWVYLGQGHPSAYASGYAMEHRFVAERALGRKLLDGEHVHHLDLDSLNNSVDNLVVLDASEHSRLHRLIDHHDLSPLEALREVTLGA